MKRVLMPLMVAFLAATCGCAQHYLIKLNNGGRITTASKPRLKSGTYYFKDAKGNVQSIPAGRVAEIAPASMAKEEQSPFKPETR
jgi:hypothetical protein